MANPLYPRPASPPRQRSSSPAPTSGSMIARFFKAVAKERAANPPKGKK